MGPIWGWQGPGGPHVGPMKFAIWDSLGQCANNEDFMKNSHFGKMFTSLGLTLSWSNNVHITTIIISIQIADFEINVFDKHLTWRRHQMKTFSASLALCAGNSQVTSEFPSQRPVTWSFDVSFDLRLNKRLSKQSWGWWFETTSWPL